MPPAVSCCYALHLAPPGGGLGDIAVATLKMGRFGGAGRVRARVGASDGDAEARRMALESPLVTSILWQPKVGTVRGVHWASDGESAIVDGADGLSAYVATNHAAGGFQIVRKLVGSRPVLSADGARVATVQDGADGGHSAVIVADIRHGVGKVGIGGVSASGGDGTVRAVEVPPPSIAPAVNCDGSLVSTVDSDRVATVTSLSTGERVTGFVAAPERVNIQAFHPSAPDVLFTGSNTGEVVCWHVSAEGATRRGAVALGGWTRWLAFHPLDHALLLCSHTAGVALLGTDSEGHMAVAASAHAGSDVKHCAWSQPDGQWAVVGQSGYAVVHALERSGKGGTDDVASARLGPGLRMQRTHETWVQVGLVRNMVTVAGEGGTPRALLKPQHALLRSLPEFESRVRAARASPPGSAPRVAVLLQSGELRVISARASHGKGPIGGDNGALWSITLPDGGRRRPPALAWSGTGARLAAAGASGTEVHVIDAGTGSMERTIVVPRLDFAFRVEHLAWSPSGALLFAACSLDVSGMSEVVVFAMEPFTPDPIHRFRSGRSLVHLAVFR